MSDFSPSLSVRNIFAEKLLLNHQGNNKQRKERLLLRSVFFYYDISVIFHKVLQFAEESIADVNWKRSRECSVNY